MDSSAKKQALCLEIEKYTLEIKKQVEASHLKMEEYKLEMKKKAEARRLEMEKNEEEMHEETRLMVQQFYPYYGNEIAEKDPKTPKKISS